MTVRQPIIQPLIQGRKRRIALSIGIIAFFCIVGILRFPLAGKSVLNHWPNTLAVLIFLNALSMSLSILHFVTDELMFKFSKPIVRETILPLIDPNPHHSQN